MKGTKDMKNVDAETEREVYMKAHDIIKRAKIMKYLREKDIISEEGLTFWGHFNGKNSLLYERIRNVKLKIELAHTEKVEVRNEHKIVDTLAEINTCALNEFSGKMTDEMKTFYDDVRTNYCDEDITDDYIYELSCKKANASQNFLPVVHQEKSKGVFADRKVQIEFYRLENKKLEDLILKERGKVQLETFSSDPVSIIIPLIEKTTKVNKSLDKQDSK